MSEKPETPIDRQVVPQELLDSEALGLLLMLGDRNKPGSASRAVQARIDRGHPMPPCITLPGNRKRLWRYEVVCRWLAKYEAPIRRKVGGRPRKLDLLAMRKSAKPDVADSGD